MKTNSTGGRMRHELMAQGGKRLLFSCANVKHVVVNVMGRLHCAQAESWSVLY